MGPIDDADRRAPRVGAALRRPELGAAFSAVVVWGFFALRAGDAGFVSLAGTSTYLEVASELGILSIAVSLLMIGGEFDLSVGAVISASGMTIALLCAQYGFPLWAAIAVAALIALATGLVNALLVIHTRLPSFIVTLGTMFIVGGGTIGATRLLTGRTQIGGLERAPGYPAAEALFASRIGGFSVSVLWWLAVAALATWVLFRTRFGNWVFGVGGSQEAARNVGIPVARVKIALFMTTSLAACLVATFQVVKFTGSDVLRGGGKELEAITAAVIGGTHIAGGYGSTVGVVFGALVFGMVQQGIVFTGADSDWYRVFLGAMLILAVLVNEVIRKRVLEST